MKILKQPSPLETGRDTDAFESVTEEEIISLWRCFRSSGLSGDEAWYAVVAGMALGRALKSSLSWLNLLLQEIKLKNRSAVSKSMVRFLNDKTIPKYGKILDDSIRPVGFLLFERVPYLFPISAFLVIVMALITTLTRT